MTTGVVGMVATAAPLAGADDRIPNRKHPAFPTGLAVHTASLFFFHRRERAPAMVNLTKETPRVRQYVQVNVVAAPDNSTPLPAPQPPGNMVKDDADDPD